MADPFGVSFSPAGPSRQGQAQSGQKPSPVQQAIQTLSLRIPRVVGAGSVAPQALLSSPGGAAVGGDPNAASLLEAIKRLLFGGGGTAPGTVGTGAPLPRDGGQPSPQGTPSWLPPPGPTQPTPGGPTNSPPPGSMVPTGPSQAPPLTPSVIPGDNGLRSPEQPLPPVQQPSETSFTPPSFAGPTGRSPFSRQV